MAASYFDSSFVKLPVNVTKTGWSLSASLIFWYVAASCSGEVLGASEAFLYSNGQMVTLGTLPGSADSQAFAINDSGLVVGI